MRFKIDENLPAEAASLLRHAGHEADTVHDESLAGAEDHRVFAAAQADARALVTLDGDFADIRAYPPAESRGVLVLRPHVQDRDSVLRLLARTLGLLDREPVAGRLWIVEEDRVRIRE